MRVHATLRPRLFDWKDASRTSARAGRGTSRKMTSSRRIAPGEPSRRRLVDGNEAGMRRFRRPGPSRGQGGGVMFEQVLWLALALTPAGGAAAQIAGPRLELARKIGADPEILGA